MKYLRHTSARTSGSASTARQLRQKFSQEVDCINDRASILPNAVLLSGGMYQQIAGGQEAGGQNLIFVNACFYPRAQRLPASIRRSGVGLLYAV
jgi:hypothetical protein